MPIELKTIPISAIIVEDRFRKEMGDIDALAHSLKKEGIIQPLAVADLGNETYQLLAGGRRIQACEIAEITEVPVRIFPASLSELERKSIELMENVARKDMTWAEASDLRTKIHALQQEIHGAKQGINPRAEGWGQADTARLLNMATGTISEDLKLAEATKVFPQITQAKTRPEALKMLKKLQEEVVKAEIARRLQEKAATTPIERLHNNLISKYILGDCLETMAKIPSNSIDLIEADPIYGIDLDEKKKYQVQGLDMSTYKEKPVEQWLPFMDTFVKECYRVMSENSWLLMWFGPEPWFEPIFQTMKRVGFAGNRIPALWYKTNMTGQSNQPSCYLGNVYEMFFYMRKGSPVISRQGHTNVFPFKPVSSNSKVHPTEKPIELYEEILQVFGWEGCRLLVPFLGSGNTLLAAANLNMDAFGSDLSEEHKNSFVIKVTSARPGTYKSYKGE